MKEFTVVATANTMADLPDALRQIGQERLQKLGYNTRFSEHADNRAFHTAGSLDDRVTDFHKAAFDPTIDGLLSVYGGYNSSQLLDRLDYGELKKKPKSYIGYSDFTAILNALTAQGVSQAYHGPAFASFCDPNMYEYSWQNFDKVLQGQSITYECNRFFANDLWYLKPEFGPREEHSLPEWRVFREGEVAGPIFGGNLETFTKLIGTPWLPKLGKAILFLEDMTGNNPGAFHREMTQLKQVGILEQIGGLIIGKFPHDSKLDNFDHLSYILEDVLEDTDIPVLCDVLCSHVDPMMTIPLGQLAHLKAHESKSVTVNYTM